MTASPEVMETLKRTWNSHGSCRAQKNANPAGAFRYKITYIYRHKYFLGTSRRTWKSWSARRKSKYLNIALWMTIILH